MSQIDFRLLQSAIVLAEELNFSRAASRLHLTQPGLTKQIQELESQLGVILFERSSQGVELTEPCRVFLENAKLAVFHLERAVHLTHASARGAEVIVNFGSSPYIDPYIVSTVLSVRLSLFPTMRVHAHSHFSHELMRQVSSGELDMAIIATGEANSRLNFLEIERHPMFALMQVQEAAARKRVTSLEDFDDRVWVLFGKHVHPTMHDLILSRAEALGVKPSEIHYFTTAEEAAYLVAKHQGIAFLNRTSAWRVARNGLTMRPIDEPTLAVKTTLVTRADDRTRLTSEYVRSAKRKLERKNDGDQQRLPLAI
jgi:DNA-binding transcriptional LysR family regulator